MEKSFVITDNTDQLARIAKALGNPIRVKILKYLSDVKYSYIGELVNVFPLAQSTISQHIKVLSYAGLINGEISPPRIRYCINVQNWLLARGMFNEFFSDNNKERLIKT